LSSAVLGTNSDVKSLGFGLKVSGLLVVKLECPILDALRFS
jgi:hypothetical protein